MLIENAIKEANEILKNKGISSYELDTEVLMTKITNTSKKDIIINKYKKIDKNNYKKFKDLVMARSLHKPISYLTNEKDFWKSTFYINDSVLIPRPETEHLIEESISIVKDKSGYILDLGVGSGCIILSLLQENKKLRGIGIDNKRGPICVSKLNAKRLGLENRVKFIKSDIDNFKFGKYDLILSNPPYIDRIGLKNLDKSVTFEPINALNGGADGTSEIRKVINTASKLIKINGKLIIEIAYNQKFKVINLLQKKGFNINKVIKDYSNLDRCIVSTKK